MELKQQIMTWDKQDITVLRDLIAQAGDHSEDQGIDLSDLPSAIPVPEQIAGYPVWAIDAQGHALVGVAVDEIEPLADVLGWYSHQLREYHYQGFDSVEKIVGPGNATSSRVNLPVDWRGKRVQVILIDP